MIFPRLGGFFHEWKRYFLRFVLLRISRRLRYVLCGNRREIATNDVVKFVSFARSADESMSKQIKDWMKSHSETPSPTSR